MSEGSVTTMGEATKIQWCDHTFNGHRGCTKPGRDEDGSGTAPECVKCYAEANARRNPEVFGTWGPDGERVVASDSMWRQPLVWARKARKDGVRRRVFAYSLADVFEDRPDLAEPRARLFGLVDATPELDWLLLTKRPERVPDLWVGRPRSNVWLGTSCGHPASLWRVDALRRCRELAAMLFVSAEPLLAEVDFAGRLDEISWLIIGGESHRDRSKARVMDLAWLRRAMADALAAGTAVFVKQLGSRPFDSAARINIDGPGSHAVALDLADSHGGDPDEWPEDLRVQRFPAPVASES